MRRILLAGLAVLCGAVGARAEGLKVVTAQKGAWSTSMTDYGIRQGFFEKEGLDVSLFYTSGGAPTVQAVISGSSDIAIDTGILGIIGAFAKGAPVRVISASTTGGADQYWYVKAGSDIRSMKDLTGKTVGYSENGSSSNLNLLALLAQAGVKAKPVASGGMPATLTQVMSGQIDVGWAAAPFGLQDAQAGKLVIIAHANDSPITRNETVRVNVVTAATLAARREALVRFTRAYARTLAWAYEDPVAISYFAEANNLPVDLARQARDEYYPRDSMQITEIKGLETALTQALENRFVPHAMTPQDVAPLFEMIRP